jgi:hypothetical protein
MSLIIAKTCDFVNKDNIKHQNKFIEQIRQNTITKFQDKLAKGKELPILLDEVYIPMN